MTAPNAPLTRYANELVGLFVILTVVVFLAALSQTGRLREWFDPGGNLRVILPAEGLFGLEAGASVEILGTNAGEVRSIVITPGQPIFADVHIRAAMLDFVRMDSTAVIHKKFGVAGDAYLEISRGTGEEIDWEFAVLEASADRAPTDTLSEVIAELRGRIIPAIDDAERGIAAVADLAVGLQDPEGSLQQLLTNLNEVTNRIERGEGAVGRLLVNATIVEELEAMLFQTNAAMAQLTPIMDELQGTARSVSSLSANFDRQARSLPDVTANVQAVLSTLEKVLKDLQRTTPELPRITRSVAESTETMPGLLLQTQATAAELEKLVRQLRSSWLVGGTAGTGVPSDGGTRISPLDVSP